MMMASTTATIMDASMSTSVISVSTVRSAHQHHEHTPDSPTMAPSSVSTPPSPHSSSQYSPSSASVSSLPSVSSSFFFSSAAASPPQPPSGPHSDHGQGDQGLIIPSLVLSAALHRPTLYGKTLGELRLLVLANKAADDEHFFTGLLSDNEDVVDVGAWEETEYGGVRVLRASTDWVEHQDGFGMEKFEPTRNVEVVDLGGYDHDTDADVLLTRLKSIIHGPFYSVSDVLDPSHRPSPVVATLVSASSTPLYTALILLIPPTPSPIDTQIIDALGSDIPIVVLPHSHLFSPPTTYPHLRLSSFRPSSPPGLRTGLFHSPETVAVLRSEAADRFLRWREVERAVDDVQTARREDGRYMHQEKRRHQQGEDNDDDGDQKWDKEKWEAEWAPQMSHDVAKRLRENTITERSYPRLSSSSSRSRPPSYPAISPSSASSPYTPTARKTRNINPPAATSQHDQHEHEHAPPTPTLAFDPLHLPSLLFFSLSLLGPLRERIASSVVAGVERVGACIGFGFGGAALSTPRETWMEEAKEENDKPGEPRRTSSDWSLFMGGFCVGVGVGVVVRGLVGNGR